MNVTQKGEKIPASKYLAAKAILNYLCSTSFSFHEAKLR